MESQMASQSGIPQDRENVDFDKELVTFSPLPDSPATPTATVPKNVFHLPPTSRQNPGFGGVPYFKYFKQNNDTQDPQHAGDPSYLGVGGFGFTPGAIFGQEEMPSD